MSYYERGDRCGNDYGPPQAHESPQMENGTREARRIFLETVPEEIRHLNEEQLMEKLYDLKLKEADIENDIIVCV